MTISSIGNSTQAALSAKPSEHDDAKQSFLDYMKMTPAERMLDAWLSRHKITKAQFNAMSSQEKNKIMSEIRQEIEQKLKEKLANPSTRLGEV